MLRPVASAILAVLSAMLGASHAAEPPARPEAVPKAANEDRDEPVLPAAPEPENPRERGGVNLLAQTDTSRGEARRNENIQITLVDTNAARELNVRVGATATIIGEFRADQNYFGAEYGNAPRGLVHVAPQHGSGVHGTLFWAHNNSVFSARSFFQVGGVKPARQNQFGGTLGTQIWKKGGYLTLAGSQDRNRGNVNGNVLIPLPGERTPLATDPALRAIVQQMLDAYPNVPPNRPDIAARALNTNSLQSIDTTAASGQFTQPLGANDTLLFRYSFTGQHVAAFQFVKGQNPDTDNKNHTARISWSRVLSADTVLRVLAGFDRQGSLLRPTGDAVGPVYLNGLQMLGPNSNIPLDRALNQFRYSVGVEQRRGGHAFNAGFTATRQQYNGYEAESKRRTLQFRDDFGRDMITNLRMGTPSTYSVAVGEIYRAFRNWELQAFAGDRWNVSSRLVLSYGIRWEPWTRPIDKLGLSRLKIRSDWNNVGGQAGFAFRLRRGVLRGAGAVLFGQVYPVNFGQDRFNPPYNTYVYIVAPNLLDPLGSASSVAAGSSRTVRFDLDPNLATPYSYQYNFSWETELALNWHLQAGYVGSSTQKLFHTYQLNRARLVDGIPFTTATTNLRRPDQSLYQRFYTANDSRAFYNAGRVTLTVPRWRNVTLTASYWFSKAIDFGSDYTVTGGGQERWRLPGQLERGIKEIEKGLSAFDQPHALLLQTAWNTGRPTGGRLRRAYRNWELTSVFLLKSGTPFTVDSGSDGPGFGNADGTNGDRPFIVDPSVLGRVVGNPDTSPQLLARSAFRYMRAPLEMAGNLGRNTFRKGKIANWNMAVARTWALAQDWTVTLRGEAINLSNTPQFAEPGTALTSPNFGQITNTLNDGRTFRFQLRLAF